MSYEPFTEKRHVRGTNTAVVGRMESGEVILQDHEFNDYVPVDILDAYLADARERWQFVEVVSDEHDPGPAGDKGLTHYPHHLSAGHPNQGKTVNHRGQAVDAKGRVL